MLFKKKKPPLANTDFSELKNLNEKDFLSTGMSLIEENILEHEGILTTEQKNIFSKLSSLLQDDFSYKTHQNKKYGDLFNNIIFIKINADLSLHVSFSYNMSPQLVSAMTATLLSQFVVTPCDDFLFNADTELYLFGKENIMKMINPPPDAGGSHPFDFN